MPIGICSRGPQGQFASRFSSPIISHPYVIRECRSPIAHGVIKEGVPRVWQIAGRNPFRLSLALPYRSNRDHPLQPLKKKKSTCVLPLSLDSVPTISDARMSMVNLSLLAMCSPRYGSPLCTPSSLAFIDPPFSRARPPPVAPPIRNPFLYPAAHSCLPQNKPPLNLPPSLRD